ncbi:MAG: lipoprotein insertase outer membrane protein LolB, partial [Thalassolituus sp.]
MNLLSYIRSLGLLSATLLISTLFLNGCASLLPQGGADHLQSELNNVNHWQVRGKLSVITTDDSVTGYLDWAQNKRKFDIYIAGPLGQG